jgi:hypothetical protein
VTAQKKPLSGEVLAPAAKLVPGADAFSALNNMVKATSDYLTIREEQRARRTEIDAYRELEVERIHAAQAVLTSYFEQVFAERASNFKELLSRFDAATEAGDAHAMSTTMSAVVALAQQSPLADLGDLAQLRNALDDPKQIWKF